MGLLEVAGPIMIGPSSSHTLGALKIARFVYKLMGIPQRVIFVLHGSFSMTYYGHGTDRALIAGALGLKPDSFDVKDSYEIAKMYGLMYSFESADLGDVHPNTVLIKAWKDELYNEIEGSSIGGGAIRITKINGVECSLSGDFPAIVIVNKDKPGTLKEILDCLSVNIANVYLRRINALEGTALTIIELDENVSEEVIRCLKSLKNVTEVYFVKLEEGEAF
ncbi:MAG TPA: L-serine ammonia-lyase, iron-sulfur-dependent subunit beta [Fervidobacterium sp.]|nr:L-serine ammonia-lyase, iron-sulfur-dependent subunit beta [Fervidobacterium sp.]HPT54193.1 L-serine ammonia-lyase, iron-sulfur-dependent subunit beta [Fervidobacterium sp.]HPZ18048.1 L-serine ammonia-lyase, iron-sulfur-dependent subunit beta [Fervidobacterium sp.]HQE49319.1 L-serine ammonia-lyase, iron-sulfur-dependent subunit beta [Fervidobacterium sp.]HUM43072.1 L-serine ammonia-lyase, iron-sulfur-dependent subunit beta [Fervidobacterium sp.]